MGSIATDVSRSPSSPSGPDGALVVVDEDYRACGLSGELAALVLESASSPRYRRVCCESVIPFDRRREAQVLPNVARVVEAVRAVT